MRIWLAGSRAFGVEAFNQLRVAHHVVAVTAPQDDALAQTAQDLGTSVYVQIEPDQVHRLDTDLIVSAQNYAYIGQVAREAANYGAVGYHPSLLPRWRGRRAVEATIEAGDPIAGGSVYLMDDGWDTGPVILQMACHVVPGWSAKDLWREALFPLGIQLLGATLGVATETEGWQDKLKPQDERVATVC